MTKIYLILLSVVLFSCASNEEKIKIVQEDTPEKLYNESIFHIKNGEHQKAIDKLGKIELEFPYSKLAEKSEMLLAFSFYLKQEYSMAISAIDNFFNLYPASEFNEYLYYLKAICYYEQIGNIKNDSNNTILAYESLQEQILRYPNSIYTRDAKIKLDLVNEHLAGKEMEFGRYYTHKQHYLAAINRFKNVLDNYQESNHIEEALYRLVENYYAINLIDQAEIYAATLGYNYPDSDWYKYSYYLLKKNNPNFTAISDNKKEKSIYHSIKKIFSSKKKEDL